MEIPIAPRASITIPISMGTIAMRPNGGAAGVGAPGKGGVGDGMDALAAKITIPIIMKKTPPIISAVGLLPMTALWVPGGGGGTTMTGLTGWGAKAKPQLEQNRAPGMYVVPHRVQTDNVAGLRNHVSRLKILEATRAPC